MKKIVCLLISIMIFSITAFTPVLGVGCSYVSIAYADEPQQETLTTDEKIVAGLAVYLNDRKAWIVNQTGDDVGTVYAIMKCYIDAFEQWSSYPGFDKATWVAGILLKYSPFRISLKGSAVRAYNDLFNWLVDSGKLENLDDSSGGQTSDNLYNGYIGNGSLFFIIDNSDGETSLIDSSKVTVGSVVDGVNGTALFNRITSENNGGDVFTIPIRDLQQPRFTITYYTDFNVTATITRSLSGANNTTSVAPFIYYGTFVDVPMYSKNYGNIGQAAHIILRSSAANNYFDGLVWYNPTLDKYGWVTFRQYNREDNLHSANINFDTDDFEKQDPTPPQNDDEIEYTPENKITGDTFNTYNQYITNYVKKNTVINNTTPEPEPNPPGGEIPPWDNSGSAGTLTPDGNGGYDLSLPDLTLPDLDIDWSLSGLTQKFPFSIPFDLMAFFTVLNADPETPKLEGTIDLGIVDWEIDWDLHAFDSLAALLRNLEFIGFCIALILITRNIIKG